MFKKLSELRHKKLIKKYIGDIKQTPKTYNRVSQLQLILFINNEVPEEDQKRHMAEVLTGWLFKNSLLKNVQTWYNQKTNREDNIIMYSVDTSTLENIIEHNSNKHVSYIGKLPIATCLGLCYDNDNQFNFERIN